MTGKPRGSLAHHRLLRTTAIVILLGGAFAPSLAAQVSVNGPLSVEVELEPGSRHTGTIILENQGQRMEEVKLYQTDYRSESPSRHFYEDPATNPRSNASWISVGPLRITIPPESRYTVPFTIDVPPDQTLSGTYWSVLMVEPVPARSPESAAAADREVTVGVVTLIRYAVRLVTHVGEAGTVAPEITDVSLALRDGVPSLGVVVANTGTRMVRTEIWAELYDGDGRMVARRDGSGGSLFPDSTVQYQVPLAEVDRGAYTALILLDCGDNNVFAVSVALTLQ